MTPAARTAAAIELLEAVEASPRPADAVITGWFRQRRYVGAKDRTAIGDRVYAVLRHRLRLEWWLVRAGAPVAPRTLAIAWLVLGEALEVSALVVLFDGSLYAPAPMDEAERALIAALPPGRIDHPDMPEAVRVECPEWAAPSLQAAFGDRFTEELAALLAPAPVDLRVNEQVARRDDALARLRVDGIESAPTPYSPVGIRVAGHPPLAGHPLFRGGAIEIQDEGSQLVALLVGARPGDQVVDFCAGAGGKALALAARMANKGRVVACDVAAERLERGRERLHRSHVNNIEPRVLSGERDRWVARQKGKFDRVLIDAPCSNSGAWRRHPEARRRPVDLEALAAVQDSILDSACRLVKPGGRLVYATCSLLPEENEARLEAFLGRHAEFRPVPVEQAWRDAGLGEAPAAGRDLRLTPARHGTDAFYVAVMDRAAGDGTENG